MVNGVSVPPLFVLRGTKLPVPDVEESPPWYSRVLGWQRASEFPDENGAAARVGGRLPARAGYGRLAEGAQLTGPDTP